MPAVLITADEAKEHTKLDDADLDTPADFELKMWQAEEIVLGYIERIDTGWTSETVPLQVKAAILMVLAHLWEHRGDENDGDPLSPAVKSVLKLLRLPVLA